MTMRRFIRVWRWRRGRVFSWLLLFLLMMASFFMLFLFLCFSLTTAVRWRALLFDYFNWFFGWFGKILIEGNIFILTIILLPESIWLVLNMMILPMIIILLPVSLAVPKLASLYHVIIVNWSCSNIIVSNAIY